jgi:hypothetical protein
MQGQQRAGGDPKSQTADLIRPSGTEAALQFTDGSLIAKRVTPVRHGMMRLTIRAWVAGLPNIA